MFNLYMIKTKGYLLYQLVEFGVQFPQKDVVGSRFKYSIPQKVEIMNKNSKKKINLEIKSQLELIN